MSSVKSSPKPVLPGDIIILGNMTQTVPGMFGMPAQIKNPKYAGMTVKVISRVGPIVLLENLATHDKFVLDYRDLEFFYATQEWLDSVGYTPT